VDIGEFLQAERHAADMSQDAVAALTGMTRSRVSDIENGMHSPTWATVERLLEGMGRRPVLDTRPAEDLFEDPADARVSAMTIEDRFQSAVPLAGFVLDRLGRRGARLASTDPPPRHCWGSACRRRPCTWRAYRKTRKSSSKRWRTAPRKRGASASGTFAGHR
jgi:transcriptional regulator with XRE-family HTH domain